MAADLNQVALVGRLTRDPETRQVGSGNSVLSGRLAFTRRERRGEQWEDVSGYVDVTLGWGNRADALAKLLTKGSRIGVTGSLRWREWETKDGDKRQALDIDARDVQLLDGRRDDQGERSNDMPSDEPKQAATDDEDLPF